MSETRFAVRKILVQQNYVGDDYFRRYPGFETVQAFRTFEAAEAYSRRREAEARETANPFRYGGASLFYQSSLDAPRLHDWLLDAGIDPPAAPRTHADWIVWWVGHSHMWTAEQLAHAWAGLDKVRFFEVAEERPTKAYIVIEINWTWHDESWLDADREGGNPIRAFRSRENAEAECARLNRERQAQPDHLGYTHFNAGGRVGYSEGEWAKSIRETTFFEVAEIEVGDEP